MSANFRAYDLYSIGIRLPYVMGYIISIELFRMLLAVYRLYEKALTKYPFLTQASTAGALAVMADILTQNLIEKRSQKGNYDPVRTIRFSTLILFWITPITYRWFLLLEKLKGKTNSLPLKRMILDQSIAAPLFTFSFIINLHILEGSSPHDALEKTKNEIVPVMKTNYKAGLFAFYFWNNETVWPLAQLVNFYLLPLRYRLVFVQFTGLFWNMYLSYATQNEFKQINELKVHSSKNLHH
ncbi:hypothetical protein LOAG_10191 [Loa loa]|uniref:Mitochondrial inner membrane protein Mpv17 n=1 Tax=Loa loa TaxID=7209 RepID=A0A1S0TRX6_LOALO|nr:hypothetical protein LOAG_10191 [Loa loa]EFO18306.1 hypothetical protein LOAG_10191 [Loa loa]